MTRRVLVTGHRGYIGAVLVPLLVDRGHDVTGCDTGLFDACTFAEDPVQVPNIGRDIRLLAREDLEGFDDVIHLAGLSNDPLGSFRPAVTFAINCDAAVRLAALSREAGVTRFLFASTCSIYGAAGEDWLTEDAPANPVTPYAVSKYRAEAGIAALAGDDFSPVYLRAGTVYGLSPRIRFDLVLNNLAAWTAATGKVFLKSDGSAWRPMMHVADVAGAYVHLLELPRTLVHDTVFNIGRTAQNYRVRELAERVVAQHRGARIVVAPDAVADRRNYRVSCERFERLLPGSMAARTPDDGARELLDALARRPLPVEAFEGAAFSRIAHLRQLVDDGVLDAGLARVPAPPVVQSA